MIGSSKLSLRKYSSTLNAALDCSISRLRSTPSAWSDSVPIEFWPPSPRLAVTVTLRTPMPRDRSAIWLERSSSGCAPTVMKLATERRGVSAS